MGMAGTSRIDCVYISAKVRVCLWVRGIVPLQKEAVEGASIILQSVSASCLRPPPAGRSSSCLKAPGVVGPDPQLGMMGREKRRGKKQEKNGKEQIKPSTLF